MTMIAGLVRTLPLSLALLAAQALAAEPLARAQPESVGFDSGRLHRIDEVMKSYVDDGRLAGAVVLIARRGRIAYLEAFGMRDRESRDALETDAIFRIASQTKALVSVGVMMLVEEGRISLSDPLGRYLPGFNAATVAVKTDAGYKIVPARRAITLRDLLTHTSGIGYGDGPASDLWHAAGIGGWYFADRDEPMATAVARMAKLPFDAQPGERFVYGYSTDILGVVIEQVTGQSLDEFLRKRITAPLGMKDTYFYLPPGQRKRLATVYSATEEGGLERAPDPGGMIGQGAYVDGPRRSFSGGAGLLSTATDYARFLQMLLDGGRLADRHLLSRKSIELMTVDHLGELEQSPGVGFGLGFAIAKDLGRRGRLGSAREFGWFGAYHTMYWIDPTEQLVVVYLTQLVPARDIDDFEKIRALVYQAISD